MGSHVSAFDPTWTQSLQAQHIGRNAFMVSHSGQTRFFINPRRRNALPWAFAEVKTVDRVLNDPISIGDTFMLAQVLHPRSDQERLDDTPFLRGVVEDAPRIGPIAAPLILSRANALRKAALFLGSMRYSTMIRTGPRSSSIASLVIGAGQCIDGVRSTPAPVAASSARSTEWR